MVRPIPSAVRPARELWAGNGNGEYCAACGESISRSETEFEVDLRSGVTLRLYRACHDVWLKECERKEPLSPRIPGPHDCSAPCGTVRTDVIVTDLGLPGESRLPLRLKGFAAYFQKPLDLDNVCETITRSYGHRLLREMSGATTCPPTVEAR